MEPVGQPERVPPGLNARRFAVEAVALVLRKRQPLDLIFEAVEAEELQGRDLALARAIVATTLRRLGQLEQILGHFVSRPLPEKSGRAREILLTAAAQLLFLRSAPHAVIDIAVNLARSDRHARHFAGLINAVLRRVTERGASLLTDTDATLLNTPEWLVERWTRTYGLQKTRAIAASHLQEPPLDLTARDDPNQVAAEVGATVLSSGTVRLEGARGRIESLPGFEAGHWWVQDAAAALPVRLLGAVAGLEVCDLCAAPGGKTAQLARAGAQVTAIERSPQRLERLTKNLQRLRLSAKVVCADATRWGQGRSFDRVLVDAPCSATGTIRHHPDVPHIKTPASIEALVPIQAALLRQAAELVRPGGLVVYTTCSLEVEECSEQIERFLAEWPSFARHPIRHEEDTIDPRHMSESGDLRTLPLDGMDGFYAARLMRLR